MNKPQILWGIMLIPLLAGCSVIITKENQALESFREPAASIESGTVSGPKLEKGVPEIKTMKPQPVSGLFKTSLELKHENGKIKLDFSLQNVSGKDLQISYGSGQKYDIWVYNEQNEEVYKWSINKAFTQALIVRGFKDAEKLAFNEEWNLNDNQNHPVPPGKYTIAVKVMIGLDSVSISDGDLTDKITVEL